MRFRSTLLCKPHTPFLSPTQQVFPERARCPAPDRQQEGRTVPGSHGTGISPAMTWFWHPFSHAGVQFEQESWVDCTTGLQPVIPWERHWKCSNPITQGHSGCTQAAGHFHVHSDRSAETTGRQRSESHTPWPRTPARAAAGGRHLHIPPRRSGANRMGSPSKRRVTP